MRVLHVITSLDTGGAEVMLRRLATAMDSHEHIIISLTTIGMHGQILDSNGFVVHALKMRNRLDFSSFVELWRLIRSIRPDVIQTWMYHSDLLGGITGRLAGVKNIVWNVRNTEVPQHGLSLTRLLIRLCAAASYWVPNKIICCAHAGLEKHASLGYSRKRMVVIGNGYPVQAEISATDKVATRIKLGLPHDALIVGIVGRYDPLKGYDIFVKAAGLLAERKLGKVLFLMVGRNVVGDNTELNNLITNFGRQSKFRLLGERCDVEQIMFALDVYCLSSRAEGFPNVVAEAMLMQVPCVVSDVGDAKHIVGPTGLVIPPEDPARMAEALYSVLVMTSAERRSLGCAARQRIIDNFDINLISTQYSDLYNSLKYYA